MFADENFYQAKVFLRAVADAQDNLRQVAQQKNQLARYQSQADSLVSAVDSGKVKVVDGQINVDKAFNNLKEVKLFQFSNSIFKKYLPEFDAFSGDYPKFKKYLADGLQKLEADQ